MRKSEKQWTAEIAQIESSGTDIHDILQKKDLFINREIDDEFGFVQKGFKNLKQKKLQI